MEEYPTWLRGGNIEEYHIQSRERVENISFGSREAMWMSVTCERTKHKHIYIYIYIYI